MSIEVRNITKLFGTQKALDNVSFSVDSGTIVGFLGPNGAGKSTLMKIITGLIAPTSGSVLVDGINVAEESQKVRQLIGYLPENNPLYLDMYVKEYLLFCADIYKLQTPKRIVDEVIEKTGLTLEYKKKIGTLSKGYKQRVGLAQAIIHNPKVLILDEPTTGLDPNQIIEIRNLILELGKEKTIMLSTHIMQEVQAICHQIAIINKGQLIANADTNEIQHLTNAKKQIIEVEFNADIDTSQLKTISAISTIKPNGKAKYIIESESDTRQEIFNFAVQHNIAVLSMQTKQKTIEEIFQELTHT